MLAASCGLGAANPNRWGAATPVLTQATKPPAVELIEIFQRANEPDTAKQVLLKRRNLRFLVQFYQSGPRLASRKIRFFFIPHVYRDIHGLPDLEGGERHHGAEDAQNVKPGDNLGFMPALFLKMMMERSHEKDPPALAITEFGVLEPGPLNDDRAGFGHKNPAAN